jgi:hypothetical protein
VCIQQCVDFINQRRDLDRGSRCEMVRAAGANIRDVFSDRRERLQSESHLDRGCERKRETEQAERYGEIARESGRRGRDAGEIGGDHDAYRHRAAIHGQPHHAFRGKHPPLGGTVHHMLMQLGQCRLIGRHGELSASERMSPRSTARCSSSCSCSSARPVAGHIAASETASANPAAPSARNISFGPVFTHASCRKPPDRLLT